jgi:multidrug resistance efflux pump
MSSEPFKTSIEKAAPKPADMPPKDDAAEAPPTVAEALLSEARIDLSETSIYASRDGGITNSRTTAPAATASSAVRRTCRSTRGIIRS